MDVPFCAFPLFSLKRTFESAALPKNYPGLRYLMVSIQKTVTGWRAQVAVNFDAKGQAQEWSACTERVLRSIRSRLGSKPHKVGDVLDRYELRSVIRTMEHGGKKSEIGPSG